MNRFRTYSQGDTTPLDDQPGGDVAFVGVDMKNDPGILPPGTVSAAVNKTFIGGEARTRLGIFNLVNQAAGSTVLGSTLFSNPNGYESILAATATGVQSIRDGSVVGTIDTMGAAMPTDEVALVQAFDKVLLFRGESLPPLEWDGDLDNGFEAIAQTASGTGTAVIPPAPFAVAMANRLFVPYSIGARRDTIGISDPLDYTRYDPNSAQRINFGTSDDIIALAPYGQSVLLVLKGASVAYLENVYGDLADIRSSEITRTTGLIARHAVSQIGSSIWFLGDGGVWQINPVAGTSGVRLELAPQPVSWPLKPFFDQVNWSAASIACSAVDDERYYLAVPWQGSTRNNAVAVYNFVTQAWEGYHTFAATVDLRAFITARYLGRPRLWVIDRTGKTAIYAENLGSDYWGTTDYAIADSLTTRGYHRSPERRRFLRAQVQIATWAPNVTITAATDGVNETTTLISGLTTSRTRFVAGTSRTFTLTNSGDNHDTAYREDYSVQPGDSIQTQSGWTPELHAGSTRRVPLRSRGHYCTLTIATSAGSCRVTGAAVDAADADRDSRTKY